MITKKGDIWKFKNSKNRGLSNNVYFYCKGVLDDEIILVRCIIKQDGTILLDNKIDDYKQYEKDLIQTSLEEFLENKYNFEDNDLIEFKNHKKYNHGLIIEIDTVNKKLTVEVEDYDTSKYKNIKVNFDDVEIVYPEFSFNDRRNFKELVKC